jgi:sigma-B regulation protein RsbU (phosphoserine phosphatase)
VRPDVVLMGLCASFDLNLKTVQEMNTRWPQMRVLALACPGEEQLAEKAVEAGACGYVPLEVSADSLVEAVMQSCEQALDSPPQGKRAAGVESGRAQRTEQELLMAGRVQAGMMPEGPPQLKDWELTARLEPALETSGDFFDFIPLPNGKWGFVVADVTDKGLGSAVFMALSSSLLRTYAVNYPTLPAFAIATVNERILSDTRGSLFVTVFYGILDPNSNRLRYVNAGHNPPLLLSAVKSKRMEMLRPTGMAIGISEKGFWKQKLVKMAPGDVLVLYTDGVTEAQAPNGDFFGEGRLQEIVRSKFNRPVQEIQSAVFDEVNRFTGGGPRQDDIAVMVLARRA